MNWCYLHPAFVAVTFLFGLALLAQGRSLARRKGDTPERPSRRRLHVGLGVAFYAQLINAFG